MRALILFLLVAAAAVGVALFVRYNGGYVMFVSPPWRVELSQNAYVLLTIVAFALMYGAIRLAIRIARLPQEVRAHRRKSDDVRQRSRQDGALIALLEGRYGRARELAEQALTLTPDTGVAALIGARAALETRDFAAAGRFLAHPDVQAQRFAVPRMMLDAELALEQGMAGEALAKLADLKREAGAHTAALRLELRALNAASRPTEIPRVVAELVKRRVYGSEQGEMIRASAHADALRGLANDAAGLADYWSRVPESDRVITRVARAAAQSFMALGGDREAADILARSIDAHWSSELVALYADCRARDSTRQLETAERWLLDHSQDAALLFALGRLCERAELWGKAQTYYEASLALATGWRTHVALGEMLARLGQNDAANAHLAAALKLALAELRARPVP
ncbi:MAG TPA: heme biosynthesis HemY N-terminal domain-containing protein [Casimicrobiaceae bacterium]|nr:heme biosynthesis HemY N-terminal domain-containing protein [Casimicrobiaceae bacterium]